ncbi:hypothetical protein B0T24DRAFT_416372 [Lasiosphaeria ovina]|uniref:Uncharacterized protein n=1 Tax=Lasiosphaeria ovina TaxID=92902 RepID=A0AAE0JY77_9PEZI|nr:hypothetical protein B0T24DRAFT_416372 [Lasiosphaeria ovina]
MALLVSALSCPVLCRPDGNTARNPSLPVGSQNPPKRSSAPLYPGRYRSAGISRAGGLAGSCAARSARAAVVSSPLRSRQALGVAWQRGIRRLWPNVLVPGFLLLGTLESLSPFSLWCLSVFMGGLWGACCHFWPRFVSRSKSKGTVGGGRWPSTNGVCLSLILWKGVSRGGVGGVRPGG